MDVLVVGAGIGGLALAGGLLDDGHRVRVIEAAPALRTGGAGVTIFSNGAAALDGLGTPLPASIGGRIDLLESRHADGPTIARVDLTVMRRRTGFPVVTVPREALIGLLASRLPAGTVAFGRAARRVDVEPAPPGHPVTVVDECGDTHTADVLVGADGQRSAVRRGVLGGEPATEVGWTTWQGLTPILPGLAGGSTALLVVGPAGLVGLMPAGNGLLQWWFDVEGPLPDGPTAAALARRFAGYAAPVPELLGAITDADLGRYPHVLHAVPDAWGRGPATLVGDAAHAFPPSQAQGANQALEDAWLLRRALAGGGDPGARLRRYERLRAVRVRRVSRMAARETTNRPPALPVRLATRLVPARLAGGGYTALIRRFSSVLAGERIG
ncbi:FAD-dependent monooxygenase [Rugosimonospora acidiphila]|uniref:FAD-dependent monooxygenase n=1 Tax=Rugosimonospora acidiphila TaxID=556531 RepID=A0ABP9SK89_9ACTN